MQTKKNKIKIIGKKKLRSIKSSTTSKRVHNRAMALLLIDKGKSITEIARLEILSESGVKDVIRRYRDGGLDLALFDRPRSGRPSTFSSADKQRVAAKVCGAPPSGRARWTIALLTADVATDSKIPTASRETVRLALHSHHMKPWLEKMWCVPRIDDEYVERMENVLDLYQKPYDAERPVVCLDEKPIQLLDNSRPSISPTIGNGFAKKDYEYRRNGTANVFCAVEPRAGRHFTKVTKRRTKPDFAEFLKDIADAYSNISKIDLVMDNLNTHNESSLIERYGRCLGSKIWSRFKVHYTPKHASWLNQAEIAIGIYSRQCLGKDRIPTMRELKIRSAAWNKRANKKNVVINWTFTKKKARQKFKHYKPEQLS